jgi:hypothetical protein
MNVLRQLDYTRGQLPELIHVVIEEKTPPFVSAVGVPPPEVRHPNYECEFPPRQFSAPPWRAR